MPKPLPRLLILLLLLTGPPAARAADDGLAPAPGRFLVAQRGLSGPYFSRTVVYLLQHDSTGTLGVIVNRPLGVTAAEVLPELQAADLGSYPVFTGGPVNPSLVVMLFRGRYPSGLAVHITADVWASSDTAMLERMKQEHKPEHELRLFTGSAGWAPGQLDRELTAGSWYVTEGDPDAVFTADSYRLWYRLINRLDPTGILVLAQDPAAVSPRL